MSVQSQQDHVGKNNESKVCFFGVIWISISDPRSLRPQYKKGASESMIPVILDYWSWFRPT